MNAVRLKTAGDVVCETPPCESVQSTDRRILSALMKVGGYSLASRGLVVAQDLLLAYAFGLGDDLDAYITAALIPALAVNVLASSLNVALVPKYIQIRENEGARAAGRLLGSVGFILVALLVTIAIGFGVAFPALLHFLASSFSAEKREVTTALFIVLLPVIPLRGLATTLCGILNAEGEFTVSCITPAVTPVVVGICMLFPTAPSGAVVNVAFAISLGAVIELAILVVRLKHFHISCVPCVQFSDKATRGVLSQFVPMIAGAFVMSCTDLVNQSIAASLGSGSVSTLNYGCKLVTWLVGFGAITVGTVAMPHFATMVAYQDWAKVKATFHWYFRILLLSTLGAMIILMVLSEPLTRFLFERGSFTEDDTVHVASLQRWIALEVPPYIAGILVVRLISCLEGNYILLYGAVLNLGINVLLNLSLVPILGVNGIAVAISGTCLFSFGFSYFMLTRKINALQVGAGKIC